MAADLPRLEETGGIAIAAQAQGTLQNRQRQKWQQQSHHAKKPLPTGRNWRTGSRGTSKTVRPAGAIFPGVPFLTVSSALQELNFSMASCPGNL